MTITEFLTARLDEESRFWANPSAMRFGGVGLSELILRMRADIAAKQAIVKEYVEAEAYYRAHADAPAGELTGLRTAVRLLAQPYAEHPDFDPAWRAG